MCCNIISFSNQCITNYTLGDIVFFFSYKTPLANFSLTLNKKIKGIHSIEHSRACINNFVCLLMQICLCQEPHHFQNFPHLPPSLTLIAILAPSVGLTSIEINVHTVDHAIYVCLGTNDTKNNATVST